MDLLGEAVKKPCRQNRALIGQDGMPVCLQKTLLRHGQEQKASSGERLGRFFPYMPEHAGDHFVKSRFCFVKSVLLLSLISSIINLNHYVEVR